MSTPYDEAGGGAPQSGRLDLTDVVERLCRVNCGLTRWSTTGPCRTILPSRDTLIDVVESIRTIMFPGYFGPSDLTRETMRFHMGYTLDRLVGVLQEQIKRGLCFTCNQDPSYCPQCAEDALEITGKLINRLPHMRHMLALDVQAAFEGDPAATCPDETIFSYPGVSAITSYRLARELYDLKVPLIPRIITEYAHSTTGIDIHPGARIGERFFIDHGTGVVIGETCEIGNSVSIYQGVTLGAKSFPKDDQGNPIKGIPRHPIVEDNVVIYAGATILGRITIGRGSVIGGNVWLTRSVPPGSNVAQTSSRPERFDSGSGI